MQLRIALAGTLRALRLNRRFRYEQLSDASVKSKISALERGEAGITLEKFESLAEALEIDPLALFALCMSARRGTPYPSLLESARENLRAMLRRLRQMGIFRDLSDDFTAQTLHPPYLEEQAEVY